jgi:death-on-curing protein
LPSEVIQFLSLDEAIAIHERLIDKFGGKLGLRDKGLLESALFRPQTGYYEDLAQMATALFESLISCIFHLRCLSASQWLEVQSRCRYRIRFYRWFA